MASITYSATKIRRFYVDEDMPSNKLSYVLTIKILFSPIFLLLITTKIIKKYAKKIRNGDWEDIHP